MGNVIDANCWREYVDEWVSETSGDGAKLFEMAQENGGVFVDEGSLIKQEYVDLKRPFAEQLFDVWFEAAWSSGGVKLIDIKGKANFRKELNGLGVPAKDHVFFRVAIHGNATHLISRDSDFYDPSKKKAGAAHKAKLIQSGKGPVCRHMRKIYGVMVCCPETYLEAA